MTYHYDDEETESEEEVKKSKEVIISNLFMYECKCGDRFVIHNYRMNILRLHRKKCHKDVTKHELDPRVKLRYPSSHPYRRQDEYNSLAHLYKMKKTRDLVQTFHVYRATLRQLVEWLEDDNNNPEEIAEYLKSNTTLNHKIIDQYLNDLYHHSPSI
jgi:hypothetical protein